MTLEIKFVKNTGGKPECLIVPVAKDKKLHVPEDILDKAGQKFLAHALKTRPKFTAKAGENFAVSLPDSGAFHMAILLGTEADKRDKRPANVIFEEIGGKLFPALKASAVKQAALVLPAPLFGKKGGAVNAAALAYGFLLRSYSFNKYKTKPKEENGKTELAKVQVVTEQSKEAGAIFARHEQVAKGVFLARDLVNEPPNILYPESFAKIVEKELKPLGVEIEILDEKKMDKLGMGAILAVGQGSARPPRICVMRWMGAGKKAKGGPLGFVGKGVTFDTGGISIKPGPGMEEMKMDMGGAAAVTGLMKALAERKAKVNVVGVIGLAENMPSGNAYRPADIVTSYAGKTIEVLNTDAEGRLVLADCLTYLQKTYKPSMVVNLATLTGAMMVALGQEYCGVFANDDKLWGGMEKASAATGEKLWRMPLDEVWRKEMEGTLSDLQNMAKNGRYGGACTAAGFLEHFIEDGTPWAHMDIAGTAWSKQDRPTVPKFGSGFGVRVLERLVADHYETR